MNKTTTATEPTTKTPKAKRVISPQVQALRDEHKAKIDALSKTQVSAKILKTIIEDKLPKLTSTDTYALRKHLETTVLK